jgi:pSer/pThr/pTyr-binding forkhead associated (FHA) protein
MELIIEIRTGPAAGNKAVLRPGKIFQVGRADWADLSVPQDSVMSGRHFTIECGPDACRVRDQGSRNGTRVNGVRVTTTEVHAGDVIVAGQTTFVLCGMAPESSPTTSAPGGEPVSLERGRMSGLAGVLWSTADSLYALLDAARDPAILPLLAGSKEQYQSLYEGFEGERLAQFAPYLVRVSQPAFLESVLRDGWGKSWGVYLTSNKPLGEVRKHFRHFLMVRLEGEEEPVYFRFYDPRVLRVFLPTCTPQEAEEFFGPVGSYLLESHKPDTLVKFTPSPRGAYQEVARVPSTSEIGVHWAAS